MFRVAGLLIVIIAAVLAGGRAAEVNAASDTVTPRLNSLVRSSAGPFTPPDAISFIFDAEDPLNIKAVVLAFTSPTGQTIAFPKFSGSTGIQLGNPVSRQLVFDSLSQIDYGFLPSGTYTFNYVNVDDWSSPTPNELQCNRDGSASASAGATLPATPCPSAVDLQALDFVINNPNGDSAAPELSSLTLPTGNYAPGDTLDVQIVATDAGSGVHSMGFSWSNTLNGNQAIQGSFNQASGTAHVTIAQNTPPGTYQFGGIIIRDRLQYTLTYGSDQTLTKVPAGITAPTAPHGFDMSATFTVINPNADTATPVLQSFSRTSGAVIGSGSDVQIDFSATDSLSGLADIIFEYDPPSGLPFAVFALGTAALGHAITQVPPAYPPGEYSLSVISVIDQQGNQVRYFRGGGTAGIPQGVEFPSPQPAGFPAMFAQADFTVGSTAGIDLQTVFPRAALANSGGSFTITVTGTGFSAQSAVFFGPALLSTISREGSTVIHAQVPGALLNGSPRIVQITVTNQPGPQSAFAGSPQATSLPFEITGFSAADVNADGCVEISDALAIRQHNATIPVTQQPCGPAGAANFDADRSGTADAADALYVLKVIAGTIPK